MLNNINNIDNENCYLVTRIAKRFNPIDRFLQWKLKSKYIHTEILFPGSYANVSFSSRGRIKNSRKKTKGVQFDYINYNRGKWRFDDLCLNSKEIKILYESCESWIGASYDTKGAVLMAGFGFAIEDADKFWCSEICAVVLDDFLFLNNFQLNPCELLSFVLLHLAIKSKYLMK